MPVETQHPEPGAGKGLRGAAYRGALVMGLGQAAKGVLSLARNVIIARLVSPEDFGIAATFLMTVTLLEMISNLSVDTLLVQDPDGDRESLQSNIHTFQLLRGVVSAGLLLCIAGPIARLFGVPEATWAFRVLAIVPLIRGFTHLDLVRATRRLNFRRLMGVQVGAEVLVMLAAWPLGRWLGDYSALLWLLVGREFLLLAGSHLLSERPYGLSLQWETLRSILHFGWPLFLNGILLFASQQGDRLTVGSASRLFSRATLGIEDLGYYSVAISLTFVPVGLAARALSSVLLPILSAQQKDLRRFTAQYAGAMQVYALLAACMSIAIILNGEWLVPLVFGAKYLPAADVVGWVSVISALLLLRAGASQGAIALGDTRTALISSLARTSGVLAAVIAAALGRGLEAVAMAGAGGEVVAIIVAAARMRYVHGIAWRTTLGPAVIAGSAMATAGLVALWWVAGRTPVISVLLTAAIVAGLSSAMWFGFDEFRAEGRRLLSLIRRRLAIGSGS